MTAHQASDTPAQEADRAPAAATGRVGTWRLPPVRQGDDLERGMELVEACGISAGQRVLDIAANRQHRDSAPPRPRQRWHRI